MAPACGLFGEKDQQRDNGERCRFSPVALTLMPDNSFPPHVSLVLFKLLPQCWSLERVSPSPCAGFLKGTPGTLGLLHLIQPQSKLILQPEFMGTFFRHWKPGLRKPCVGLAPLTLQGEPPQPRFLSATCECGTNVFCFSASPTSLSVRSYVYP